jgi:hypothetical protein
MADAAKIFIVEVELSGGVEWRSWMERSGVIGEEERKKLKEKRLLSCLYALFVFAGVIGVGGVSLSLFVLQFSLCVVRVNVLRLLVHVHVLRAISVQPV